MKLAVRIGALVIFGGGSVVGAIVSATQGSGPGVAASIGAGLASGLILWKVRNW